MNKKLFIIVCMMFSMLYTLECNAKEIYRNEETGYVAIVEDDAKLFKDDAIREFEKEMADLTRYGNVCVKTIEKNNKISATDYANDFYDDKFGEKADGTILLIDMDNREIVLTSEGRIKKDVTSGYADSIMDNVYGYASDGKYELCCKHAFLQVMRLLEGKRIAQPMKHICNGFIAIILAIIINYGFVKLYSRKKKDKNPEFLRNVSEKFKLNKLEVVDKKYYSSQQIDARTSSSGSYSSSSSSSYHSSGHSHSYHSSSRSSSRSSSSHSTRHSSGSHRF